MLFTELISTLAAFVISLIGRCLRMVLALVHPPVPMPPVAAASFCISHLGISFVVFRLERGEEQNLRFFWKHPDGSAYAGLSPLRKQLSTQGEQLIFAVNGGIYSKDLAPLGLYIENGKTISPLNREIGDGNFFLLPNGVFSISEKGAQVVETIAYHQSAEIRHAIQSGPMLVIKGEVNQRLIPGCGSRHLRNGVGVDSEGRVVFAISDGITSFHDFGTLFRDRLDCRNALYLDGQISRMYLPEMNYHAYLNWRPMVTIIGLSKSKAVGSGDDA